MIRTTLLQHESFEKVCQSLRLFERKTVSTILEDLGDDNVGCSCSHLFFHKGPEESAFDQDLVSCGRATYLLWCANCHHLALQLALVQDLLLDIHVDPVAPICL
jgi:hypothetical protein